jgi:hypothetical protein
MSKGWIGVDLDRTLVEYHGFQGMDHIGEPVLLMVERVRKWLSEGQDVRIFTARVYLPKEYTLEEWKNHWLAHSAIEGFCVNTFNRRLPITCCKDLSMIRLYDDLAVQVEPNTGRLIGHDE